MLGRRVDPERRRGSRSTACRSSSRDDLVYYLLNKPAGYVSTASDPRRPPDGRRARARRAARVPGRAARLRHRRPAAAHQRRRPHPAAHASEPRRGEDVPRRGRGRSRRPATVRTLREGVELDDGPHRAGAVTVVQRRGGHGRDRARDPRGPQPPGPAHVRGGRPPGAPPRAHAHRAARATARSTPGDVARAHAAPRCARSTRRRDADAPTRPRRSRRAPG